MSGRPPSSHGQSGHRACSQCQAPENKAFQLKVIKHTLIEEDELFVVEEQDSSAIKKTLRALNA